MSRKTVPPTGPWLVRPDRIGPGRPARRVYFDYAGFAPVDPRVLAVMRPFLEGCVGNPAAAHALGEEARDSLAAARAKIARLVGGRPSGMVFVSGATEANNLAVKGVAERGSRRHLVTTEVEHPSILAPCRDLERSGYEVTCVTVDGDGRVDPAEVREAIRPDTCLVSMSAANGEVGAVQPWRAIARVTQELGVPLHVDAVGVLGRLPLSVEADGIDLLTVSANDLCGPPGVGALWIRPGLDLRPQTQGGDQEVGLRAGTENLAGVVGLGVAAELALRDGPTEAARLLRLRDRLIDGLTERCRGARLTGPRRERLPHHVSLAVAGVAAERLVQALDLVGISVALRAGSAGGVSAARKAPLLATAPGVDAPAPESGLAVSLGRWTSADEVEVLLAELPPIVDRLRERPGVGLSGSGDVDR